MEADLMTELENIIDAVAQTGKYLRRHAFDDRQLQWKKANDPVTCYDKSAEQQLKARLTQSAPGNFLGEEYGAVDNGHWRRYLIDSIDGTKQWVTRDFRCAMSLGIEEHGELVGGIVYDFMKDIMYVGYHGECSIRFDGKSYPFRTENGLTKKRVSIEKAPELRPLFPKDRYAIMEKDGSFALSMAEIAAGNYDVMVHNSPGQGHIWDVAAGYYLCKATGCEVREYTGQSFDYRNSQSGIIVLRPEVKEELLAVLPQTRAA
jgi:myo-inositol-1(or 4)-monophosphatase